MQVSNEDQIMVEKFLPFLLLKCSKLAKNKKITSRNQYKCGVFLEDLIPGFHITWLAGLPDALVKVGRYCTCIGSQGSIKKCREFSLTGWIKGVLPHLRIFLQKYLDILVKLLLSSSTRQTLKRYLETASPQQALRTSTVTPAQPAPGATPTCPSSSQSPWTPARGTWSTPRALRQLETTSANR